MYKYILKYYSGNSLVTHNITPIVDGKLERVNDAYRKRIKFSGKITLHNHISVSDYTLFKTIESISFGQKIFIEFQRKENNIYVKDFEGYTYPFNCTVNDDLCKVELGDLTPFDEYSGMDEIQDVKYNLIKEVPPHEKYVINDIRRYEYFESKRDYNVVLNVLNPNCLQPNIQQVINPNFPTCIAVGMPNDPFALPNYLDTHPFYAPNLILSSWYLYNDPTVFPYGLNTVNHDWFINNLLVITKNKIKINHQISGWVYNITVTTTWAVEVAVTADDQITLAHNVPTGGGWYLAEALTINGLPHAKYLRVPLFDNPVYEYALWSASCSNEYIYELKNPNTYGALNASTIFRGRGLSSIVAFYMQKAGLTTAQSKFFYDEINPVTGENNTFYTLNVASDLNDPQGAEDATIMDMSFDDLMQGLKSKFPVEWVINKIQYVHNGITYNENALIIEHINYFENGGNYDQDINTVLDVRGLINNSIGKQQIIKTNNYIFDVENIVKKERFEQTQFFNDEFNSLEIIYDIDIKNSELNRISQWVTDVGGVITNYSNFGSDSIVLVGIQKRPFDENTFQWDCWNEQDYITGVSVCNGHLTPANLINNYWRTYRILLKGVIGDLNLTFDSVAKKKLQNISISDCNIVYLQSDSLIKTNLGIGRIISARHDLLQNTTELTLLVGYEN